MLGTVEIQHPFGRERRDHGAQGAPERRGTSPRPDGGTVQRGLPAGFGGHIRSVDSVPVEHHLILLRGAPQACYDEPEPRMVPASFTGPGPRPAPPARARGRNGRNAP
ncbi:hypothetical protein Sm713_39920 [Streptomyces sp. TS71-3]|nr:hypothetical protein Sm713_39920 [Streptomyces sp. TS71-3]